jgi:hypothetical protein
MKMFVLKIPGSGADKLSKKKKNTLQKVIVNIDLPPLSVFIFTLPL